MAFFRIVLFSAILTTGLLFQNCDKAELPKGELTSETNQPPPPPPPPTPESPLSSGSLSYVISEGDNLNISLSVATAPIEDVSVAWSIHPEQSGSSLIAANDFMSASGTISILKDQKVGSLSIASKDNLLSNPEKKYVVDLTYPDTKVFSLKITIKDNDVPRLSGKGLHNCLLREGALKCWGYNGAGELGDGTAINRFAPADVVSMGSDVSQVSAGTHLSCAVKNSGAFCWGGNSFGQIGNGITSAAPTTAPQAVINMSSGVTRVAAGSGFACGIRNGALFCWGNNSNGTLGNGLTTNSSVPVAVSTMAAGVKDVDVSIYQMWSGCAVKELAGKAGAYCWGINNNGQLGDGTLINRNQPVAVVGLDSGVTSIGLGGGYACAVKDGGVYCWGYNGYGQLGVGDTTSRLAPVKLNFFNGKTIKKVSVGGQTACAIVDNNGNNEIYCWGGNTNGQLGIGNYVNASLPQRVLALDGATDVNASAVYDAASWGATTLAIIGNKVMVTGANGYGQFGNNSAPSNIFILGFMF